MITVVERDDQGRSVVLGRFDENAAIVYPEKTEWDGSNNISRATGSQWEHERLLFTATRNRWVLNFYSNHQGTPDTYEYIDADRARNWLLTNGHDEAAERRCGFADKEIGPGRPAVGPSYKLSLPPDLRSRIEAQMAPDDKVAATIRDLLDEALTARTQADPEGPKADGHTRASDITDDPSSNYDKETHG